MTIEDCIRDIAQMVGVPIPPTNIVDMAAVRTGVANLRHELKQAQGVAQANIQRAEAAEAARDSCYRAAAEVSEWLNTANKAVEVVSARAVTAEADNATLTELLKVAEAEYDAIKAHVAEIEAKLATAITTSAPHRLPQLAPPACSSSSPA